MRLAKKNAEAIAELGRQMAVLDRLFQDLQERALKREDTLLVLERVAEAETTAAAILDRVNALSARVAKREKLAREAANAAASGSDEAGESARGLDKNALRRRVFGGQRNGGTQS